MQNVTFSKILDKDYLFTALPKTFDLLVPALVIGLVGVLLSVAATWYFKKRRGNLNIIKEKRHIISLHAKINLGIWIAYLVFWFFRTQQTQFLSMRFFLYFLALASLTNVVAAVVMAVLKQPKKIASVETTSSEEYQKYLPKKRK